VKLSLLALIALGAYIPIQAQDPREIDRLRAEISRQQKQIDELRTTLSAQQALLEKLAAKPAAAQVSPGSALAQAPAEKEKASPLSFRIGNADFTPGGFMDITHIFRSTDAGSGIGTSFGSIPLENTAAGKLTESRFSAQNSRVSLNVTSAWGGQRVTGYLEADFLGALPANAHVTSNSNSMRMRLYWVRLERGKWDILGGQSWSLLTPNRKGLSPVPSDLFYSQDMDTNYQVGLTWTRAPQFRVAYHVNKNWTAGFALENPEQYVGGAVVVPSAFVSQVDNGSNTATPNTHPDVIAKVAWDGDAGGRALHVEAAGVYRTFRTAPLASDALHASGVGGSLNANLELVKNFRLIVNTYFNQGGGRYIFGLGPDLIVRPNGSISPVHSASGIGGFEYQARPISMFYGYYGGAYFRRNYGTDAGGQFFGFGFPGSAGTANRAVQEGTFGYIHTFWKRPEYGALQVITQYSYLTRNPWTGGRGHANMFYTNLRYVLP
jgi:hypothetical protein